MGRRCRRCRQVKPHKEFARNGRTPTGGYRYRTECKICYNAKHRKKKTADYIKRRGTVEGMARYLLSGARSRAKHKDMPFALRTQDIVALWERQKGLCAITGWEMTLQQGCGKVRTNCSIDRIDCNRGYEISNVQLVCHAANTAKSALTSEEFMALCQAVVGNYNGRC